MNIFKNAQARQQEKHRELIDATVSEFSSVINSLVHTHTSIERAKLIAELERDLFRASIESLKS